jgi:hypothetical protein
MFGFFNSQPQNYLDVARDCFKDFHNSMCAFPNYKMGMDQMIDYVGGLTKASFLDTVGWMITENELDSSEIEEAMRDLAQKCQGQLPARWQDAQQLFIRSIGNKAQDFSWVKAASFTVTESAKDVVEGVQEIGDTVIGTGKVLMVLFPIAAIAAIGFILFKRTKQAAG